MAVYLAPRHNAAAALKSTVGLAAAADAVWRRRQSAGYPAKWGYLKFVAARGGGVGAAFDSAVSHRAVALPQAPEFSS